jgi:hypothetical protein
MPAHAQNGDLDQVSRCSYSFHDAKSLSRARRDNGKLPAESLKQASIRSNATESVGEEVGNSHMKQTHVVGALRHRWYEGSAIPNLD